MSNRIRWEPTEYGGFAGYVGTLVPWAFQIYVPSVRDDRGWILQAQLPGALGKYVTSPDDPDELKAEAERWLEEFISSLGASFKPEAAVRQAGRQSECPIEAVFPDRRIPCTYRRGHGGPHSFITGADQEAAKAAGEKEN